MCNGCCYTIQWKSLQGRISTYPDVGEFWKLRLHCKVIMFSGGGK